MSWFCDIGAAVDYLEMSSLGFGIFRKRKTVLLSWCRAVDASRVYKKLVKRLDACKMQTTYTKMLGENDVD